MKQLDITTLCNYTIAMELDWDENKRLSNLEKHKIDFVGSEQLFDGYTVTVEDDRQNYGEQRFVTFGNLNNRIVAVVHTETKETIRIISIRKATKQEIRGYHETIKN